MRLSGIIGGVIFLIIGVALYSYAQNQINEYQTFVGQLGRALSSDQQQAYASFQFLQMIGLVTGVIGVGLLIFGAAGKAKGRATGMQVVDQDTSSHTQNRDLSNANKVFCRYCGKLRLTTGTFCSECGKGTEAKETTRKRCVHCHATMSSDSEFCANCGRKF